VSFIAQRVVVALRQGGPGYEVSEIRNRQTTAFRPGARGCSQEVDCHFRMS
jgi:hypothetical protein